MTRNKEIELYRWCRVWVKLRADFSDTRDWSLQTRIIDVERRITECTNYITRTIERKNHRVDPLDSLT